MGCGCSTAAPSPRIASCTAEASATQPSPATPEPPNHSTIQSRVAAAPATLEPTQPTSAAAAADLIHAVREGDAARVRELIDAGAPLDDYTTGPTPLQLAARDGLADIAEMLCNAGANIELADARTVGWSWPPLLCAIANERPSVVRVLLQHGADTQVTTPFESRRFAAGLTALEAAQIVGQDAMIQMLEAARNALVDAVGEGDAARVRELIDAGAPLDDYTTGPTPLQLAAKDGLADIAEMLCSAGANIELANQRRKGWSWPPLLCAVANERPSVVRVLLKHGADTRVMTVYSSASVPSGLTALEAACHIGQREVIELLDAATAAPEWDETSPYFYFVPAATVLACDTMGLPRMQALRDADQLVKQHIDLAAAFRGEGIAKTILFVSHRWETPGAPDTTGDQLAAMKEHLRAHPELKLVWYDYSTMPQRQGPERDGRSIGEKQEFNLMLSAIADLYLTSWVLILLDNTYAGRFWTLMEAWCSMMTVTSEGVRTAAESERRYTIKCIHNASPVYAEPALVDMLSTKTPPEVHDILARPDVCVTNLKDKETMLPIVSKTDEHVREMSERNSRKR